MGDRFTYIITLNLLPVTSSSILVLQQVICISPCLINCLFPVPDSQPAATELFQLPLYGSGTVFRSTSHLLRHFLSFAVARRHTSSNSVIRNYCYRAREVTVIYGHVNCSYLLTYFSSVIFQKDKFLQERVWQSK